MCGRYELKDGQKIWTRFHITNKEDGPTLFDNLDMRPAQMIPTIIGEGHLTLTKWGFTPSWAKKPLINAKAEGLATAKTFKKLLPANRCIIPATAFYEWQTTPRGKVPYVFRALDQEMFGFAGLWEEERDEQGVVTPHALIITTTPNAVVAGVHDRMPVILTPAHEDRWLNPDVVEPEHLIPLLRPYPDALLAAHVAAASIFRGAPKAAMN